MPSSHPPSVFVSSTCYDLSQVRQDIHSFLISLGLIPILSEFPSFPVDPSLGTVENCLAGIKEKADIFVLVVGGRYGSETENGKSVTNLEYLEARAKGIPRYVFVQKHIMAALSNWQKDRTGDYSEIVDSPKLFEFVDSLSGPKENWVFSFESARDIIETLRTQLAYLFQDALTIRGKARRDGLPETLQDLSRPAFLLAVQRPFAWEFRLFSQILRDEISRSDSIKRDLNYGLAFGKSVRLSSITEITEFMKRKIGEILLFIKSANALFDVALPKAFGAPGKPGDVEEIVYVGRRLGEFYRSILEWTLEFKHIQVDDDFKRLLELISQTSHNAIGEIEEFAADFNQQVDVVVQLHKESKQLQPLKIMLKLTMPDMTEFDAEICRLKKYHRSNYSAQSYKSNASSR